MLRATLFPAPYNSFPVLTRGATTQTNTCHSLAHARALHALSPLVSRFELHFQHFRRPRVSLRAARGHASATKRRGRGGARVDDDKFDYYDEEEDDVVLGGNKYDDDDDEEEDDDDVDEEGMLPLEQMRKWLKNKPKGFGEGKVYDTSVEDKLLEEMRQSQEAQAANLKKLKSGPVKSNNSDGNKKVVPIGGRVRLVNLPKKKNIHRDLKSAFEGIPGMVNIVPAVTGNEKTRDPVCKGFAFVDFKCEPDAVRFVELYSGQSITFGKIQKQIKCELVNAHSSSSASPELSENLNSAPHRMVSAVEEDSNEDSYMEDSTLSSWDGTTLDDSAYTDNQIYEEEEEEEDEEEEEGIGENQDSATALAVDYDGSEEMRIDSEISSLSLEQVNINPTAELKSSAKVKQENARKKKQTSKEKAKKVPKLDVPGSAKRLKIKEKAVLSDVFSKYGSKAALTSKDS